MIMINDSMFFLFFFTPFPNSKGRFCHRGEFFKGVEIEARLPMGLSCIVSNNTGLRYQKPNKYTCSEKEDAQLEDTTLFLEK